MAFDANVAQEQLIRIYQKAYTDLLEKIAEKQARGTSTQFQRSLLRDVENTLEEVNGHTKKWAEQAIPKTYKQALEETRAWWRSQGADVPAVSADFQTVHKRAVQVIAENFVENMTDATAFVGRRIRDQWRRTALDVIGDREATGETLREAKKKFLQRMSDRGFTAFRDVRGRQWRLDAYADMAIRSTGREVTNTALINQQREFESDHVQFTSHANPCEICAPLEGRVYSISGNDDRFPALDKAFEEGYANIHPNCRHSLRPYVPEFDDDVDSTARESNRSFQRDPRTQAEKEAYEREQTKRRREREDRKQYERYKLALPDDAPKTFAGFKRMKEADSERYRQMQADLRHITREG